MDSFRVRLNCIDYYQAIPIDDFDPPVPRADASQNAKDRPRVSVLRIFGATETGQRVLMHVHGAFQYTYIEYAGSLLSEDVEVAIRNLNLSIDHALAVSYRKNIYEGKHRYVAHISLVKGVPFYGYHVGYKFYLKIYMLNPLNMTRLADLMREGAIMKRVLQPYESHMQYIAQWMCDYNLYGCGYIDVANVKFRAPVPSYYDIDSDLHQWHDRSVLPENISDEFALPKQSQCALEVDICVHDILNRKDIEARHLHHDFIERLKPIPLDAKLVQSMAGLWKDETRRRKARMGIKDPNSSPFPPEVLVTMSADPRETGSGGWVHEQEYRTKIEQLAAEEKAKSRQGDLHFDNYIKPIALESSVRTTLESVEDLYPHNMARRTAVNHANEDIEHGQVFVDEELIQGVERPNRSSGDTSQPSEPFKTLAETSDENGAESVAENEIVDAPISSSEYEKYGIHRPGDDFDPEEEAFEIPPEYINGDSKKRARFAPMAKPRKRRRLLVDQDDHLPDVRSDGEEGGFNDSGIEDSSDGPAAAADPSSSIAHILSKHSQDPNTKASKPGSTLPKGSQSSQNSTLQFPVVKKAQDTTRLSQSSSQADKLSQGKLHESTLQGRTLSKTMSTISPKTPGSASTIRPSSTGIVERIKMPGLSKLRPENELLVFHNRPPTAEFVTKTLRQEGLPDQIYQEAYYSNEDDVPDQAREYAGREFKLESHTITYLPEFDQTGSSAATFGRKNPILLDRNAEEIADNQRRKRCTHSRWSIAAPPPRPSDVMAWLDADKPVATVLPTNAATGQKPQPPHMMRSQIDLPTQNNKHGFKFSGRKASTSAQHATQYMSIMSLEVHVNTRGSLAPNPEQDEVASIFWCVQNDDNEDFEPNVPNKTNMRMGILALSPTPTSSQRTATHSLSRTASALDSIDIATEATELDLLTSVVDIVRLYDPDVLTGYEVHNSSWGYLIERARTVYDMNLCDELSRMKTQSHGRFGRDEDRWGFNHASTIRVTGRHTINIWRAMKGELNLLQYTLENIAFHLLQRRVPHYAFADLTRWFTSRLARDRARVLAYFCERVRIDLEILEANELVARTSEQARLLGVDWYSVISRGSQFKVESLMFRIAKAECLLLASPSRRQVGGQNALECLPLVMEPMSDFYSSPLLVLDFQSLYPSVMIAYNYCYSTFLGRVVGWRGVNKMGFSNYQRQEGLLGLLKDYVNVAPNGIMYVKKEVRKSLLAKMLSEILETRVMVKSGMKVDRDDKALQQLLNNRQLALKLIANVTYGYTSASFSGRMPCSEIADSIVQTGRETLEKAIAVIHATEKWGAEVVYGDTDSLFVYLKGRTREQAFDIGENIAETITRMNPRPVKLKFEKVYHPCVLLAKKRYVGFKYESRDQMVPEFDAKGIETVRRDGTPAEQKIEEMALKVLFRTADLSKVKAFFQAQCAKIMRGRVSIQDFCFAREVKLGTYSDKGPPPPGALISARRMVEDPRLEPQYGERVPYVVVTGGPGARLIDRCVSPDTLLNDAQSELDAEYYISKNLIPPLERIFNLVGANVRQWYDEMPKYQRIRRIEANVTSDGREVGMSKKTLESYMKSSTCLVCRESLDSEAPICSTCVEQAPQSLLLLRSRLVKAQRKVQGLLKICRSCEGSGFNQEVRCDSKDCPVFYSRTRTRAALRNEEAILGPVVGMLENQEMSSIEW